MSSVNPNTPGEYPNTWTEREMEAPNSKPNHNSNNKENKIFVLTCIDRDGAGGRYTRPGAARTGPLPAVSPESLKHPSNGRAHVQQHDNLRLCEIPHLPAVLSSNPCQGGTAHHKVPRRPRPRCIPAYTRRSSASGSKGPRYTHGGLERADQVCNPHRRKPS
jgi:hypothetical protein